jgi:hypothetical protein
MRETTSREAGLDWAEHWRSLVAARSAAAGSHGDSSYWDRRAPIFARSTRARADEFLEVVESYLSPHKTLIDVGAGAGRHSVPLAGRLEWVTAVEPSEGMRAQISPRDNMTVVASTWEEATVAPADLVICCHVMYGVEDAVPFIAKMERSAHERIFVMMREGSFRHPASVVREQTGGREEPPMPRFSDLFMLLVQMGVAPDVTFIRYPLVQRYADFDEALADCRAMIGADWDEGKAKPILQKILVKDGENFLFDGGVTVSGIAHWRPIK